MGWEELTERLAREIATGGRPPGARAPSVRALAREAGCSPGTAARALSELRRAGAIAGGERSTARVAPDGASRAQALLAAEAVTPLRLAGSDDPGLDALLRAAGAAVSLVPGPRGSVHGLSALAQGSADAATVHLRHAASGRYNDPFVRHLLGDVPVVLVHLWRREQGLVGLPRLDELDGRRVAARPPGTASHLLLERLLAGAGASPARTVTAESHLGVAAAVADGAAEAGVAVRAAPHAADVAFRPLAVEPFELAIREDALPRLEPLLDLLRQARLRAELDALTGYDLAQAGELRRPT